MRAPSFAAASPVPPLLLVAALACASGNSPRLPGSTSTPVVAAERPDSTRTTASVAGKGSLRQDEISLRLQFRGVMARMFPMDQAVIELLAPDSYKAMRNLLVSQADRIERARSAAGAERFSIWYVSFQALEPDARFSPSELLISAAARDFHPLEIIPLSSGFSEQRIQQGQSQTALYLFDPSLDTNQPLETGMEGVRNSEWAAILRVLERERVRLRAGSPDTTAASL